jgi:hypothetical protein
MAIGMFMDWSGVGSERYDRIRGAVDWEGNVPDGALFHVATFDEEGSHIFDLWESAEAFQTFVDTRLMPAVQAEGIETEPEVRIFEVHATFTPAFNPA